jgi:hypothetical protein
MEDEQTKIANSQTAAKMSNLGTDIVEMLRGNVANLAARHLGRASKPDRDCPTR